MDKADIAWEAVEALDRLRVAEITAAAWVRYAEASGCDMTEVHAAADRAARVPFVLPTMEGNQ